MRHSLATAALVGTTFASTEPCAQVASQVASNNGLVEADVALQCLQSVPVDKSGDLMQLNGLLSFVNFQSTLAYLKDPTPGYPFPAVDVLGQLQTIKSDLQNDRYDNEFDIQNDILNLWNSVHDGHFVYTPDITQVFTWTRSEFLTSVSKDGTSVPQPYVSSDIEVLAGVINAGYTPSPVTKINGQKAETFLETLANSTSYNNHDPDACYNQLFPIVPLSAYGKAPNILFSQQTSYQGTSTTLTFANGSTSDVQTFAFTSYDWSGVTDGASFFQKFCSTQYKGSNSASASVAPSTSASASSASATSSASVSSAAGLNGRATTASSFASSGSATVAASGSAAASTSASVPAQADKTYEVPYSAVPSQTVLPELQAYPKAWVEAGDRSIACYFPSFNNDAAVLSVPSFDPDNHIEFSDVIRECLATAAKKGKTKLIIDLRGNGGGDVILAYDFFKQLFPSVVPWGSTNFRAWQFFEVLTKTISTEYANTPSDTSPQKSGYGYNSDYASVFNANMELNISLKDYTSWKAFYGPVTVHNDTFTNLVRYNLSSPYVQGGAPIAGYGNLTNIVPKQTFAAHDIVMLYDGQCASTCTVFSEFMKSQEDVGSVAFGGRAQTGPMQGIGGTKGANDYALKVFVGYAFRSFSKNLFKQWSSTLYAVQHAISRSTGETANVNFRNNIRQGDETLTPLQFVYEAADCRLFYTAAQILDQELVWKSAYASYWNGAACVQGSTNQLSSKPGDGYILASPGATSDPTTPSTAIVSPTSTSNPAVPMRTAAALAAMIPAFAAGAMLI